MQLTYARLAVALFAAGLLSAVPARDAMAQLKGHYIPGFSGLQNGTQPPPGISIGLPLYFYTTNDIRDDDGNRLGVQPRVNASFIGIAVAWVTHLKLFGGNVGGAIVPITFMKSRIEGKSLDVPGSFAFSDIEVQPIQLGWETSRADVVAEWGVFMPTGKWVAGGRDNSGLGMWSNLFQAGTTVHLDDKHRWTVSSLASYEIHSRKRGSGLRVGDLLTIEGGLGRTFLRVAMEGEKPVPTLITSVGLAYYGQFKLTPDQAGGLTSILEGRKDRAFAVGVEGNVMFPKSGTLLGLRIEPEFGARNRTQGWTFMLTAAYALKSVPKLFQQPPAPAPQNASTVP